MANKRRNGEGSISKRPDGTWWAGITIGVDKNEKRFMEKQDMKFKRR